MLSNSYPMLQFALGEEIDIMRDTLRRFVDDKILPRAADIDRTDTFPRDLWEPLGALGLHGLTVSEEYGGVGLGYLAQAIAVEEISRASASVGLSFGAHGNLCINQIFRWGNEAQKARYLPKLVSGEHLGALAMSETGAGSDVVSMTLRAEKRATAIFSMAANSGLPMARQPMCWWSMPKPSRMRPRAGLQHF